MNLIIVRLVSIIVIALVYMLFDLFNKRNVPELFAYATLGYGILLTLISFDIHTILISAGLALIISGLGYIVYKIGQIGAADVIELAAISLIIPFSFTPLLITKNQIGLPFILSVFVATGIFAMVMVPIYYLPKAWHRSKKTLLSSVTNGDVFKAFIMALIYIIFIAFLLINSLISYFGAVLLAIIMLISIVIIIYQSAITSTMVEYVGVSKFDDGDIIAFNLMSPLEISAMKKKIKGFDRLITQKLINKMKQNRITKKFPVYKNALPLALPIFIAVIVSILIGNIMLLVI